MVSPYFGWAYSGVNVSLTGSGGPECVRFLSDERKICETILVSAISVLQLWYCLPEIKAEKIAINNKIDNQANDSRNKYLALLCFTFGIEVGFKLSTRQVIWLLNPCHMITAAQIYLLSVPPSKTSLIIFRFHLYYLVGPIIALIIPVVHSRKLLLEREMYFFQHILILIAPHFIMKNKVYKTEELNNFKWCIVAQAVVFLFHFTVLQGLSILTQVNLDNIMCPAPGDPFSGPWYRIAAIFHQTFLITIVGKFYPIILHTISNTNLTQMPVTFHERNFGDDGADESFVNAESVSRSNFTNDSQLKHITSCKNGIKQC